jgi:hypothetical protein
MDGKKITYLPTPPIRYNGSTPSMSRRGGVRLHPISDGTANLESGLQYLRTRDGHGQKLRDVTDPQTGMYTHSVSAMESRPNFEVGMDEPANPPISGNPTGTLRYLPASVRLDSTGNRVYLDEAGRRIRTTDMDEETIGAVPAKPTPARRTKTTKRGRGVDARAPKPRTSAASVARETFGPITDDAVRDFIRAKARLAGAAEPTVFPLHMMQAGREALKVARKQAELAIVRQKFANGVANQAGQ